MNKEIETAQKLVQIGSEVAELGAALSQTMVQMMILSQSISAIQARIQVVTHHVLDAPPPERFEENTSFGLAENHKNQDGASSPEMEPLAHDGGEAAYSADNGTDDRAPGTNAKTVTPPQSEQAVHGGAPADVGAPPAAPEILDAVLDRFAVTGHGHNELANEFGVGLAVISLCLSIARGRNDRRAAAGDLKRSELMEGKEPAPAPTKPSRVKRVGPGRAAETKGPELEPVETIEPSADEIGRTIVAVFFTDGVVTRADTHQELRLPGPLLRILALFKDQRWYALEDAMKAARIIAEPIFETKLQELQRGIGRIGLHIVRDADQGLQLRRIAPPKDAAEAA